MAMRKTIGDGSAGTTVAPSLEVRAVTAAACLFRGFGDRSRVAIVQHLLEGEHRVVDLTAHLGLAQSTVSKHLACLLDCGLVSVRAEGRSSVYSLAHREATVDLLAAAERLLGLTGDAAVLCPRQGATAQGVTA
ncbi:metalloregulator ArsR/SmtB family transcription factor [Phycicoccus sp.]|uniref:ArsR/SmtB family transcription factor n=1 Tax=Phycicoccus sp. TaxID=1902410 RepID=UPI002B55866B|nr:metalloregulator ArsR/SmtB family transcription factor [Phycicoccus sp.]HMM93394.1 metalloregulator ArsR/SmtB family transcription factor [Phycicoccus sp.]